MPNLIGLDIGGTKIAGAVFSSTGEKTAEAVVPTPPDYAAFIRASYDLIRGLEAKAGAACTVGIGIAGRVINNELADASPNMQQLRGKALRHDLEKMLGYEIRMANDANCVALAEALEGAGKGFDSVYGMTLGTGIGGGFVFKGQLVEGKNGLAGELAHLPLPFREEADGPLLDCDCGLKGCIEKSICGKALASLYTYMTGKTAEPKTISELARARDADALHVLDRYYEVVAKAVVAIVYAFDPEIIVVSGNMIRLPGLFEEVPKRWHKSPYTVNLATKFVPAQFGPLSGMRGAALLW